MTRPRFENPMPPLSEEQFAALRIDIERRGVMVPVEIDADTGETVDGAHRQRIAEELGINYPRVERRFADDGERLEHALKLNLLRRQLDDEAWSEAFETLAAARGVRLEQGARNDGTSATVAEVAKELGVSQRSARRRRQNAKKTKKLRLSGHGDLADKVKRGELDVRRAERLAREEAARTRAAESVASEPSLVSDVLRVGDFRSVLDDLAGAVAAVVTDPPYETDADDLYPALAEVAARLLRPGGTLVVLCGTRPSAWLRRLAAMEEHMPLRWVGCYLTAGAAYRDHSTGIATNWKPILIFGGDRNLNSDVFRSSGNDKEHHRWGQNEDAFASIVRAFSDPGDLVVDPFLGGGTTAVICKELGREFVGCDVDASAVGITFERMNGVLAE